MSEDFDLLFKVVLIGDCAVGKSWFVLITCFTSPFIHVKNSFSAS